MKLKKLQIKNIASIIDATIDFTKPPLADDSIFLISGETGSGKTTILNSICIALYNAVPAFAGLDGKRSADCDGVNLVSPLQLVRRECREACIVLDFIGPDAKNYTIEWRNARHRKRTTGAIDDKTSRHLRCLDDDACWDNMKEMNAVVGNIIGYTFDQFCRTTMLAQGQFLKFINSSTPEKTDILEKLTGTEIYSEVGKQIFQIAKEHAERLKDLQTQIDALQLPPDEEIVAMAANIAELDGSVAKLEKQEKEVESHEKWLAEAERCKSSLEKSKSELAAWTCDEIKQKIEALRLAVANWNNTADIRRICSERIVINNDINAKSDEITSLWPRFGLVCQGLAFLRDKSGKLASEIEAIDQSIADSSPFLPLINGCDHACGLIGNLTANNGKIARDRSLIEQNSCSIADKTAVLEKLAASQSEIEKELKRRGETVNSLSAEIGKLRLTDLRKEIEDEQKRKELLAKAMDAVTKLHTVRNELTQLRDDLADKNGKRQALAASIATARESLALLKQASDDANSRYQGMADLASKIAELTQVFAEEKECPLCGSPVDHIRTRDILDAETAKAKEKAAAAESDFASAKATLDKYEHDATVLSSLIAKVESGIKLKEAEENKAESAAKQATGNASISLDSPSVIADIDGQTEKAANRIDSLNKDLSLGLEIQNRYNKAVKLRDDCKASADKLREKAAAERQSIEALRIESQSTGKRVDELYAENAALFSELSSLLPATAPAHAQMLSSSLNASEIIGNPDLTKACIRKLKADYDSLCSNKEACIKNQSSVTDIVSNTELTLKSAEGILGKVVLGVAPKEAPGIEEEARRLCAIANTLNGQILALREKDAALANQEGEYYAAHPKDETHKLLESLACETPASISSKSEEINNYDSRIVSLLAVCRQCEQAVESLKRTRPKDMPDELTLQQASADRAAIAQQLITMRDHRSALKTEHERVKKLKKKSAELEKQRDDASAMCEKWSKLSSIFGDAKGKEFRKIAQSFIFHELLRAANEYLAQLLPRYELSSDNDENMLIYVIDHNEGDARRLVNSLSGGEGFIASLALALALSSINGNKEQVDTLFIDEGFGSLSDELLVMVIDMLCRLQNETGRRVAVISHMHYLKERIQTQIQVKQTPGASSSTIAIVS